MLVKYTLDERVHSFRNFSAAPGKRGERVILKVGAVPVRDTVIIVNIIVPDKIAVNIAPLLFRNRHFFAVPNNRLANEISEGRS